MQHIEIVGPLADLVKHYDVIGCLVFHPRVQSQRHIRAPDELRRRPGVRTRKECHLTSLADELLGQVGDDALRAAVESGETCSGSGAI